MSKGLIRSGSRRGVRSDKSPPVARKLPPPARVALGLKPEFAMI